VTLILFADLLSYPKADGAKFAGVSKKCSFVIPSYLLFMVVLCCLQEKLRQMIEKFELTIDIERLIEETDTVRHPSPASGNIYICPSCCSQN